MFEADFNDGICQNGNFMCKNKCRSKEEKVEMLYISIDNKSKNDDS